MSMCWPRSASALLLFLVGLKLDLQIIRNLGPVAVATGLGQVIFTSVVGFAICMALGFSALTSTYIAVALTFSSTIIIVKLLSDKGELDSLHGRIALGFLIVQDIAVVVAMVALSSLGVGDRESRRLRRAGRAAERPPDGCFVGVFIRYAAEPLLRRISRVPELLVTFAIAWAVLFAAVGDWLGFGKELGGLLAGVSLASTSVREAIASRLSSLRDFLLLFFFIGLGSRLDLGLLGEQVPSAILLSAFVLIGNPLIVMAIMGYMGYRKRTGFLAGLTVAQISEFSLIFMAMGLSLGHLQADSMGLVTLVGLVTITLSTYMILYSHSLYRVFEPYIGLFERRMPSREIAYENGRGETSSRRSFSVSGATAGKSRRSAGARHVGAGHRFRPRSGRPLPQARSDGDLWRRRRLRIPEQLPLHDAKWILIAIQPVIRGVTHDDSRISLIKALRQANYAGQIAVRCHDAWDMHRLTHAGADIVLLPFSDAAERAIEVLGIASEQKADRPASG
jgi:Kef-type K+ transport system membrane component KefB